MHSVWVGRALYLVGFIVGQQGLQAIRQYRITRQQKRLTLGVMLFIIGLSSIGLASAKWDALFLPTAHYRSTHN
jgi:hypothetical protein